MQQDEGKTAFQISKDYVKDQYQRVCAWYNKRKEQETKKGYEILTETWQNNDEQRRKHDVNDDLSPSKKKDHPNLWCNLRTHWRCL